MVEGSRIEGGEELDCREDWCTVHRCEHGGDQAFWIHVESWATERCFVLDQFVFSLELTTSSILTSFAAEDLQVDWRVGAEFFESHLIDHEVFRIPTPYFR